MINWAHVRYTLELRPLHQARALARLLWQIIFSKDGQKNISQSMCSYRYLPHCQKVESNSSSLESLMSHL